MIRGGVALLVAAGCGGGGGPAARTAEGCQMELVTHLAPLPPSPDPAAIQYTEVAAREGVAYLGTWNGEGVLVLDLATGQTLAALDPAMGPINSVALAGRWLAVAPRNAGVVVYDVADPRRPARRASAAAPARNCHTVFVQADVVYCSTFSPAAPHLVTLRVTAPADPAGPLAVTAAGSYTAVARPDEPGGGVVHDVFVQERAGRRLAYLAYWERGLQIVDVTDPSAPRLVGASPPTPGRWTHSVWVDGRYAYAGEESWKGLVRIYDVSSEAAPVEVGALRSSEGDAVSAHNVQVANGFVYASWYQDGLRAFPAVGPAATTEAGYFHTWDGLDNRENPAPTDSHYAGDWDVFVDGDRIFASDTRTGLWLLRHHPAAPACPADRPRGTSAFATSGRPPFGFVAALPYRLRPGRPFPIYAVLTSVDDSFSTTDPVVATLQPSLEVTGATPVSATEVVPPGPGPARASRTLRRWARLGSPVASAQLVAQLDDGGSRRRVVRDLELLPEPPPNTDLEPNDDDWVSGVLRPAGEVVIAGTLGPMDRTDVYLLDHPPGPLRIRLLGHDPLASPMSPDQPSPALSLWRAGPAGSDLGRPARQPVSAPPRAGFDWEMVFDVPADEAGPLLVTVAAVSPEPQTYQLELLP